MGWHALSTDVVIMQLPMFFEDFARASKEIAEKFGDRQIIYNFTTDNNEVIFIMATKHDRPTKTSTE